VQEEKERNIDLWQIFQ